MSLSNKYLIDLLLSDKDSFGKTFTFKGMMSTQAQVDGFSLKLGILKKALMVKRFYSFNYNIIKKHIQMMKRCFFYHPLKAVNKHAPRCMLLCSYMNTTELCSVPLPHTKP